MGIANENGKAGVGKSYLASVLLKEKVLKTEEIRERIEAYVAGEAYGG